MIRDLGSLLTVQLLRLFGINEILHSNDKKKKNHAIFMVITFLIVLIMLILYIGMMAYSLQIMGLIKLIPSYMFAVTSAVIMIFTIVKTNGILFGSNDYELLTSLPISQKVIVASRFLTMYLTNFVFTVVTMFPSAYVYVSFVEVSPWYYGMLILSAFLIPLIPMTIAAIIGTAITAIASRMKHKNLITIVFTMTATLGIMVLSFGSGSMNQVDYANLSLYMTEQLQNIYPLTQIYSKAIVENNGMAFLMFALFSIAIFYIFVAITAWKYVTINSALKARKTKNHYNLLALVTKTPLQALYQKEKRRYFSSPVYVLNTGIGYIIMLVMGLSLCFMGVERFETLLSISGLKEIMIMFSPLIISAMASISSTTSSAISLEGKQWEILLSLPVDAKTIFDSKLLLNLTLSIPASLLTSLMFACVLPFEWMGLLWLFLTPIAYCLFAAVIGLTINLKLPNFSWENETVVIKQSAANFVFVIIGMVSVGIPIAVLFAMGVAFINLIFGLTTIILYVVTLLFYFYNLRIDLRKIG
ncbi:MAG: hypothetical protein ACERKN_01645 [Velocimicrobium sp.]